MSDRAVAHATVAYDRLVAVRPERAFAAWANPDERRRWDVPGHGWVLAELDVDFRVGGRERSRFGPSGAEHFVAEGEYLDIVPASRIISAGTMHRGDVRTSSTLFTVEFHAEGRGTRVFVTDQSVFYGPESAQDRRRGWGQILERMQHYLERSSEEHDGDH